jgi:hypothetical protein
MKTLIFAAEDALSPAWSRLFKIGFVLAAVQIDSPKIQ